MHIPINTLTIRKGNWVIIIQLLLVEGYNMDSATVMILEKKNDELRIKVLNVRGEVLLDITV